MKVAICGSYGGFGLSEAVLKELDSADFNRDPGTWARELRADPRLIAAIEKVGLAAASTFHCKITIVDVPDDVEWFIDKYDGFESVHEAHRVWG